MARAVVVMTRCVMLGVCVLFAGFAVMVTMQNSMVYRFDMFGAMSDRRNWFTKWHEC